MVKQPSLVAYLMVFWISWRCSHAFLTSMSFNRARVPMVRCSLAGFWKMLSSTPWSYNWITTTCWNDLVLCQNVFLAAGWTYTNEEYSTCVYRCSTSSLNFKNPSWILGPFRGNDRKCVKGCFFLKLSIRTSIRVTADDTAALWEPVITVRQRKKFEREYFGFQYPSQIYLGMPLILTNLSFHSLFWDVDRCLGVKLQTSACLSLFPNDVPVEHSCKQTQIGLIRNKTAWSRTSLKCGFCE